MLKKSLLLLSTVACSMAVYADDTADMQSKGKCKKFNSLTVCGNITAGSLNVSGSESVGGNLAVSGNETVGGNLAVTGNETVGGTFAVTGTSALTGQLTLTDPVIAVAAGGNLLDYANYTTNATTAVITGAPFPFNATFETPGSFTLTGGNTINFVNAGVYFITAYISGETIGTSTGFTLSFGGPTTFTQLFSGAVDGATLTTMNGSTIVTIDAGQTMQLLNASNGTWTLSNGGVATSFTAGINIIRLQ